MDGNPDESAEHEHRRSAELAHLGARAHAGDEHVNESRADRCRVRQAGDWCCRQDQCNRRNQQDTSRRLGKDTGQDRGRVGDPACDARCERVTDGGDADDDRSQV